MSFINFAVLFTLEDKQPLQRWVHLACAKRTYMMFEIICLSKSAPPSLKRRCLFQMKRPAGYFIRVVVRIAAIKPQFSALGAKNEEQDSSRL